MVTLPQKFIFKMLLFPRRSYCCCAHMDSQYQFPLRLITECCDMTPLAHLTKYKSLISYLWIGVTDLCGLSPLWKRLSVLNLPKWLFGHLGAAKKEFRLQYWHYMLTSLFTLIQWIWLFCFDTTSRDRAACSRLLNSQQCSVSSGWGCLQTAGKWVSQIRS